MQAYGSVGRTIGDWFIHLSRANFRVDQILEPGVSDISPVPTTLILGRAKKGLTHCPELLRRTSTPVRSRSIRFAGRGRPNR